MSNHPPWPTFLPAVYASIVESLLLLSIADVFNAILLCHFIIPGWEDELKDESVHICHDGSLWISMFLWKPGASLAELALKSGPIVGAEHSEKGKKLALSSTWKSAPRCMDIYLFLHLRDLENCTKRQNNTAKIVFVNANLHRLA